MVAYGEMLTWNVRWDKPAAIDLKVHTHTHTHTGCDKYVIPCLNFISM